MPTPVLSYTVRKMGLGWGIVITASHNPKQYNGYKVYDARGVQVIPEQAKVIMEEIDTVEFFENPSLALEEGAKQGLLSRPEGVMESFIEELYDLLPRTELTAAKAKELPVVYSGLYGSGAIPVSTMLKKQGFEQLTCIQMNPDSNFGGLYMPNPEDARVYAVALDKLCDGLGIAFAAARELHALDCLTVIRDADVDVARADAGGFEVDLVHIHTFLIVICVQYTHGSPSLGIDCTLQFLLTILKPAHHGELRWRGLSFGFAA